LLLFGFLFTLLGLLSEYIGMIYEEVRGRPTFIVRTGHGLEVIVDGEQRALAQHIMRRNDLPPAAPKSAASRIRVPMPDDRSA
jgi:hypothetical protein